MTVTPQEAADHGAAEADYFDVLIVGAGISGIDAAYRITERNPQLSYAILERRARIGGTWDLFRYPGVRSDSSIFTLSFPFEPWTRKEGVADGCTSASTSPPPRTSTASTATSGSTATCARRTGTRPATPGRSPSKTGRGTANASSTALASCSSAAATTTTTRATPRVPGHRGVHRHRGAPQHWPEDLDYTGKKVVVIGSGATAVTLLPSLSDRAAKVTMLQRSPTYLISASKYGKVAAVARKVLPRKPAHLVIRMYSALTEAVFFALSRKAPRLVRWLLRRKAINSLPPATPSTFTSSRATTRGTSGCA